MNNKNIYIKLQEMRKEFHSQELKKSGKNSFAGYSYFELKDIIPVATVLLEKYRLTTFMNCGVDGATLTLINGDNPSEQIVFTVPAGGCNLKGCHEIQNVGAVITYQKRYLMVNLFDVIESDGIEATTGKDESKTNSDNSNSGSTRKLSEAQVKRLYTIASKAGFDNNTVNSHIKAKYNKTDIYSLTKPEYDTACSGYEAKIS